MVNHFERLDRVFHALADPSRRTIVDRLSRGPASVSQLAEPLDMSLPAVMQHLAVLEASGLVRTEKLGRVRTCTLESDVLSAAEAWIHERRTDWVRRLDRLGELLDGDGDNGRRPTTDPTGPTDPTDPTAPKEPS
ncbi:helix-turn-helix transcriptional regulator [Agromyces intestinalis]|uniref:Helix-turn-helix transcriptional regulator n=1 Tax=Agromyces intestinalis TaxID=2592652 RepID=A0A5C1YH27_9MICO|nr:metalloregulator ArsR/SmtB family transcription factor [Agromyces intestinalis]QEO14918.1 helix-turn-helix transcriptional regulator [Agromyces intestinalis]